MATDVRYWVSPWIGRPGGYVRGDRLEDDDFMTFVLRFWTGSRVQHIALKNACLYCRKQM